MTQIILLCLFALATVVSAQESMPEGFQHWTADALKDVNHSLKSEAAADPQKTASRHLADFANDTFILAHREGDGVAEWHETQADVFFVQSGSATLVVGGTMVGADETAPHEKRNGAIQGGVRRKLMAGDVVRIPAKMPHQILLDGGHDFTYFVVKVKGY